MASEWPTVSIEDLQADVKGAIAIGPFGSRMKSECYVPTGVPVIRGTNISGGPAFEGDFVFIPEELADSLGSCNVYEGDLVFPHRGSIGEVGIVEKNNRYVISSSLMKLTCNHDKVIPKFLFYFFKSSVGKHELLKNASQVGTPGIGQPLTSLKSIRVKLPPKASQAAIVEALGALDNKIELNRQINTTLESMAQALFKSWFVDFDPVIDNALAAGNPIPDALRARARARQEMRTAASANVQSFPSEIQQLFPNNFVFTEEMGWAPENWRISTAGEEFTIQGGSTPSTKNPDFWEGGDIHWTTPKDLSGNETKLLIDTDRKITFEGLQTITSGLLPTNTVLMSSRAPVGYLAISKVPVAINQGYIALSCDRDITPEFSIQWLDSIIEEIKGISGGTTFAEISKKTFRSIKVMVPERSVIEVFSAIVKQYYDRILISAQEIETLSRARDTLLPRLLSGQLRVGQ